MGDFHLVEGPFDGAHGPTPVDWVPAPSVIWVYPDPLKEGPFGLCASKDVRIGASPYLFREERESNLFYTFGDFELSPALDIEEAIAA